MREHYYLWMNFGPRRKAVAENIFRRAHSFIGVQGSLLAKFGNFVVEIGSFKAIKVQK